jgi:hypothetical protein
MTKVVCPLSVLPLLGSILTLVERNQYQAAIMPAKNATTALALPMIHLYFDVRSTNSSSDHTRSDSFEPPLHQATRYGVPTRADRWPWPQRHVARHAHLSLQQQLPRPLDSRPRIRGKLLIRRIADRMAYHRELVIGHAEHPAHHFGGADEARRHHPQSRDALPFCRDGVVQTAR